MSGGKRSVRAIITKHGVVRNNFDWGNCKQPLIPMEELVIYELHVRGFTKDKSSMVKNPGTSFFRAFRKNIVFEKFRVNARTRAHF